MDANERERWSLWRCPSPIRFLICFLGCEVLPHDIEGEDGIYSVANFLNDYPIQLEFQPPKDRKSPWIFWSKQEPLGCLSSGVREKIKFGLSSCSPPCKSNILVQFWAPSEIEGRCYLTTSNQPFALNRMDRGFCQYRKHCLSYQFVDGEESLDGHWSGLPDRVFRHRHTESTPNVGYYPIMEYPLRHFASVCGVRRSLALPVFEKSSSHCVGVLELLDNGEGKYPHSLHGVACSILEGGNLKSDVLADDLQLGILAYQLGVSGNQAVAIINVALEIICKEQNLPLAQSWARLGNPAANTEGVENINCSSCVTDILTVVGGICNEVDDVNASMFRRVCGFHHLRKGWTPVEKSFVSRRPFFCRNVTKLGITEYPLAHYASEARLTACFWICLSSSNCGNDNYVLEFFLPPCDTLSTRNLETMLKSILATMKQHFCSFRVASGEELGEELSVEVIKVSADDELNCLKIGHTTSSSPGSEGLHNEGPGMQLDKADQHLIVEDTIQNELNLIGEQRDKRVTCLDEACRIKTLEREHKVTEPFLSYEVIMQHFGRKLEDAAESLDVSRSTLKRICRKYGIPRWPSRGTKKVKHSHSNHTCTNACTNDLVQGDDEQIPKSIAKETSCSDLPRTQATAAVAPMQDQSTVVIKVTYGEDIIKFKLLFSSGMAELVEKVAQRLNFKVGTLFRLKYQDEDGDWVLVTCDEDLHDCIRSSGSLGKNAVKFVVQPITSAEGSSIIDIISTSTTNTTDVNIPTNSNSKHYGQGQARVKYRGVKQRPWGKMGEQKYETHSVLPGFG